MQRDIGLRRRPNEGKRCGLGCFRKKNFQAPDLRTAQRRKVARAHRIEFVRPLTRASRAGFASTVGGRGKVKVMMAARSANGCLTIEWEMTET
jgi:hypothetical protein